MPNYSILNFAGDQILRSILHNLPERLKQAFFICRLESVIWFIFKISGENHVMGLKISLKSRWRSTDQKMFWRHIKIHQMSKSTWETFVIFSIQQKLAINTTFHFKRAITCSWKIHVWISEKKAKRLIFIG